MEIDDLKKGDRVRVHGYEQVFKVIWTRKRPIKKVRCRDLQNTDEYEFPFYKIEKKTGQ